MRLHGNPRRPGPSKVYIESAKDAYGPENENCRLGFGRRAGRALTTVSLQTVARGAMTPLPLEEIQQLSAVFGLVKTDYVEPVDDKKLITDAISGMVASLDPHSQYFDKVVCRIPRRHIGQVRGRGH